MTRITTPQPPAETTVYQGREKTRLDDIQENDWVCFLPAYLASTAIPLRRQVVKVTATQITLAGGSRFLIRTGKEIRDTQYKAEIVALGATLRWADERFTYDQLVDRRAAERAAEAYRDALITKITAALPERWGHIKDAGKLERILAALTTPTPPDHEDGAGI